jgi:adenylosuccinate synthase
LWEELNKLKEEILKKIAVIGLGFGDEGKGRVVDWLCSKYDNHREKAVVVRFSGGANASHNVFHPDGKVSHAFSHLGSGTFRGVDTYWSEFCPFDPIELNCEISKLIKKDFSKIGCLLYVNSNCPVVTPYDHIYSLRQNSITKHGSCGMGIAATWEREENHYSLRAGDLLYPDVLKYRLEKIKEYYKNKGIVTEVDMDSYFQYGFHKLLVVNYLPSYYTNYIFEGSQGLLLDQNYGFFPHVTRSNTGTQNLSSLGFDDERNTNDEEYQILVTRAYQTRHGNGFHSTEHIPHNIRENPYEKNVTNIQGEFRRGLLDLDLLRYAISKDKNLNGPQNRRKNLLVVTCLDLIENEWRLVNHGKIVSFLNENEFLKEIKMELGYKMKISRTPFGELEDWGD